MDIKLKVSTTQELDFIVKRIKHQNVQTHILWRLGGKLYGIWLPPAPRLLLLKSLH